MKAIDHKGQFKQRVRLWADKLDVKIVWLGVRPMRNKWASCSTAGHLNFSDELPALKSELWDYVIVHELLHFSVPNHGKLWKSLMRAHLGEYEAYEGELKQIAGNKAQQRTLTLLNLSLNDHYGACPRTTMGTKRKSTGKS